MENKLRNSLKLMRIRENELRKIVSSKLEDLLNCKPQFQIAHQTRKRYAVKHNLIPEVFLMTM